MRRIITIPLILVVGGLVLWEAFAWGTRTWVKYGLLKQPLPSLTTQSTTPLLLVISALVVGLLIAMTVMAVIKSRKLFGIIPPTELTRHLVVLGPTGSGKTTVAKAIIAKVMINSPNTKLVIIDWKGEYNQFIPMATVVRKVPNIWDVPGESAREKALLAVELIREMAKDVVEVTPASSLLLLKVLEKEYEEGVPTTEKIISILERNAMIASREGRYAESNMYYALIRRLYILLVDEERTDENIAGDAMITIYDLGNLASVYLKTLYANYVLSKVYREAVKFRNSELKTLLVAEEAQNYIHPRRPNELPSLAERLVYELRAFGVGIVLVCPDPELIPTPVLRDVGTIIATSPDSLPRFVLERHLFRASLEEAEDTLKKLKKAKATIVYRGQLHFLRRLPRPPKLKPRVRPKGDRMGVTDSGMESLRAWPILPHRSPGRPKVVEVEESAGKPKVEIKEESMATPKVVEVVEKAVEKSAIREELRLEEEEEYEESETITTEPAEAAEEPAVEVKESEEELTEEMPLEESKPEPAPEGPPIPSTLPYRGPGRSAQPGAPPHWDGLFF